MNDEMKKCSFEFIRPADDAIIVCYYLYGEIAISYLQKVYNEVKDAFPKMNIIMLPDKTTLSSCSTGVLEQYLELIGQMLYQRESKKLMNRMEELDH